MADLPDHADDRTIAISGHILRQSVTGSDLSYEDMMEDRALRQTYGALKSGEGTVFKIEMVESDAAIPRPFSPRLR